MRGRGTQDIAAGAVVVAFAVAVLIALARIPKAKFQAISPDLFPRVCAFLLIAAGIALVVRGLTREGPRLEWPQLRGLVLVILGVVAFGVLTPRFGYAVGGFVAVVVAGFATRAVKPLPLVVFAAVLIALSVGLFTYVLKVPMPPFALRGVGA